jgi:hypothetical protein
MFSWDVAVQKARTAVFFSNAQLAQSTRTVGFLSQRFFPPASMADLTVPTSGSRKPSRSNSVHAPAASRAIRTCPTASPFSPAVSRSTATACSSARFGISGDGVDQDDIIGSSGCADFLPKNRIRADSYTYRGVRLPYVKFPRDPVQ